MSLKTLQEVLKKANAENYAVGAFNVHNLEMVRAVIDAAQAQHSPIILQTNVKSLEHGGFDYMVALLKTAAQKASVPVVLNLDHSSHSDPDLKLVKKVVDAGYTAVMFDGSHLPFEKNILLTQQAVKIAHAKGVGVEGELGTIGGVEDSVHAKHIILTDPAKAKEFVDRTHVDALAVAIGTSHGAYKFTRADQQIDIRRLAQIKELTKMPLVLHGASVVLPELVDQFRKFGGFMERGHGLSPTELKRAVRRGINKVNTDTDLRLAFTAALRQTIMTNSKEFDPRKILTPSREAVQKVVEDRIKLLGSSGKA